jgi:hypothetical protein
MAEANGKTPSAHRPRVKPKRSGPPTIVYQPAVPIRSVLVFIDRKTNELRTFDETVLGIQVVVTSDGDTEHQVIVWDAQDQSPVAVNTEFDEARNFFEGHRVVGPTTLGDIWFQDEIQRIGLILRHRQRETVGLGT